MRTNPGSLLLGVLVAIFFGIIAIFTSLFTGEAQRPVVDAPPTTSSTHLEVQAAPGTGVSSSNAQSLLQPAATAQPATLP